MADTYTIDGQDYTVLPAPTSSDGQLTPGSPFPSGASWSPMEALRDIGGAVKAAPDAISSAVGPVVEGYKPGLNESLATTGTGIARAIQALHNKIGTPGFDQAYFDRTFNSYKKGMEGAPEIPDASHIRSAHDAALWFGHLMGSATPLLASAFLGGAPAAATLGAIQGGEQAAESPNATPASITTGAALNAATNAMPVPFLKSGGGLVSKALRGVGVGAGVGAAQGATANIPEAVATGNPADALPNPEQLLENVAGGAAMMGTVGAAHGAVNTGMARVADVINGAPAVSPDKNAARTLAQRINTAVDQNGYDLSKVAYNAGDGAKAALDQVHNGLASDIKFLWSKIAPSLGEPVDLNSGLNESKLTGIIKSAVNKLKGRVGDDDLQTLQDAVGHTQEGHALVDAVRQSNHLTDLFNGGLKGGVSRFTDLANPFGGDSKENSFVGSVIGSGRGPAEMLGYALHPGAILPGAALYAGGRAVDALTGRRSTVARFVDQNSEAPQPLDFGTRPSIMETQAKAAAALAQFKQAQDALNLQAQQRGVLQRSSDQFDKQQTTAQQAAESARLADREQELRTQNRLDNNPGLGGFDRSVYDQTGLPPQETTRGLFELNRTGRITPHEFTSWFKSPRTLMQGNAGNHIFDMLDTMARNGQLERDPNWQKQPDISAEAPQVQSVRHSAAYEAQAAGNQARVTAAMERVANSEHSSNSKQRINDAIAAIGRTNNRADAESVRQNLVQSLANHSPEAARYAHQELEPLVSQIRHATADTAVPKGADLRAVTTDVTRDGNVLTRTLAAAYKLKYGIDKPAYDGKREPDQGYLKAVADFHDKAVHDPSSPAVKDSYGALARETTAQFKSLGGLKVETWTGEGEPYANSKEMMRDVGDNHHLWFLPTDSAFGSGGKIAHPMLADTGLKTVDGHPLLVNDVFRIVHDFYGHTQHGFQFGPVGEYNAFREHAQMYSDKALPALAAETLAQNAWVNFGPHSGLPVKERPFSDQKAYAFPPELIARDPNLAREYIDTVAAHPEGAIKQGLDVSAAKPQLHDLIPGYKGISKYLTPAERENMLTRTAKLLVDKFTNLPSANEMAAVAFSGRAKKGWYNNSAKAIVSVFGQEDAPRFSALLAALSPQTDVETNFNNAVNVWRGWIEAGRPKDEASIMRIMGENVEGDKGPGSVLPAWLPNSVRALTAEEGTGQITISGPKVSSFMQNLLGEVNEVTNDTWMANWAGIQQTQFKGADRGMSDQIGNVYTKGAGYLAMSALTRKAADTLSKQTGETWTPAEVQETVWSWAKALYEKANSKQSASDIVKSQSLTHGDINSVPDFEMAFVKDTYAQILDLAGYGDNIDNLKYTVERASNAGSNGPGGTPFSAEGSGFSQASFNKYLGASASRLDALRTGNDTGRAANAANAPGGADIGLNPGEDVLARHPTPEAAQKVADAIAKFRPTRVMPEADGRYAVVAGPKPQTERPMSQATSFVSGIEHPDGTMKGLTTPEVRTVASTIARLVEGGMAAPGQNGVYSEGNNTIHVYGGMEPEHHARVLGHETGHAIEALAGVATTLKTMDKSDPLKAFHIVKQLSSLSALERPLLWESDSHLERTFSRDPKYVHEYRGRYDELLADSIAHYMQHPAETKKVAPLAAQFIRDLVNPSKIGKVIAFAGLGSMALPGLISQALSSFYSEGDNEAS